MNTTTLTHTTRRELARRVNGGIEITLFWDARDDSTSIDVHHRATGETVHFGVPPSHALDAFHHPFAHLAEQAYTVPEPDYLDDPRSEAQ